MKYSNEEFTVEKIVCPNCKASNDFVATASIGVKLAGNGDIISYGKPVTCKSTKIKCFDCGHEGLMENFVEY